MRSSEGERGEPNKSDGGGGRGEWAKEKREETLESNRGKEQGDSGKGILERREEGCLKKEEV